MPDLYRPSNATEGEWFESNWCCKCQKEDVDTEVFCGIHTLTLGYGVEDKEYPVNGSTEMTALNALPLSRKKAQRADVPTRKTCSVNCGHDRTNERATAQIRPKPRDCRRWVTEASKTLNQMEQDHDRAQH